MHTRTLKRVILTLVVFTSSCAGDDGTDEHSSIGTDGSGADDGGTDDGGTDDDDDIGDGDTGDGTCTFEGPTACTDPPPGAQGAPVPSLPVAHAATLTIDSMIDCPVTRLLADTEQLSLPQHYSADVWHPDDGFGDLPSNPDRYGLVIFTHGNSLSGEQYSDLMSVIAKRGLIGLSITNDVPQNTGGNSRKVRLLCMAEAVLNGAVDWVGNNHLTGEYILAGHSTGGLGAHLAVRQVLMDDLIPQANLLGSIAIAPVAPEPGETISTTKPIFFLTMMGSGDGDPSGAAFAHFDAVRGPEVAGKVSGMPRKALIWPYNVGHTNWGGVGLVGCQASAKAIALMDAYVGAFLGATFYENSASLNVFFSAEEPTPIIPQGVANAPWPEFGGEAHVFGTSSQSVTADSASGAWVIDGFENNDPHLSDSGLAVTIGAMLFQEAPNGGSPLFDNSHFSRVGAVNISADPTGTSLQRIRWELSCPAREALTGATTLTFHIGFHREVEPVSCVGEEYELPDIDLVIETLDAPPVRLNIAPFARLALPDARDENDEPCTIPGTADGCHAYDSMQATVRVPLGVACKAGVSLADVTHLGLEFSANKDGTLLILDDFEIRRTPGEPNVECRCG